jgi:hypothetical protein
VIVPWASNTGVPRLTASTHRAASRARYAPRPRTSGCVAPTVEVDALHQLTRALPGNHTGGWLDWTAGDEAHRDDSM